jgi:hypothetical protein
MRRWRVRSFYDRTDAKHSATTNAEHASAKRLIGNCFFVRIRGGMLREGRFFRGFGNSDWAVVRENANVERD